MRHVERDAIVGDAADGHATAARAQIDGDVASSGHESTGSLSSPW